MADGAPDKVQFDLVSPERSLISDEVDMVVVPGASGDFGVLPLHSQLISLLRPGVIEVHDGGKIKERIFVAGGFAEVNEQSCTVLAEEAARVGDLSRDHARRRLSDAQDDLGEAKEEADRARFEREVRIAEAMVEAAGD
jgi:F-type H+-transporting ATPase subunit epsilon